RLSCRYCVGMPLAQAGARRAHPVRVGAGLLRKVVPRDALLGVRAASPRRAILRLNRVLRSLAVEVATNLILRLEMASSCAIPPFSNRCVTSVPDTAMELSVFVSALATPTHGR